MRAFKKYSRGFTLVELMIVVAIIGVLAALAIYGVRRYLQSAKTSEAKQSVGAITRGGIGAFERETTAQEVLAEAALSTAFSHNICAGATSAVPAAVSSVQGKKYQPSSLPTTDYEDGNATAGWKCLKFTMGSPSYFQYGYRAFPVGGALAGAPPTLLPAVPADSFTAWAQGDLDGDSTLSAFGQSATVNITTRSIRAGTQIAIIDEFE